MKICRDCLHTKPLSEFYQHRDRGWTFNECKNCHNRKCKLRKLQKKRNNDKNMHQMFSGKTIESILSQPSSQDRVHKM
jgi:hypothetical protein